MSHKHVIAGQRRFEGPEQFVDVVDDLFYTGTSTVFQTDARKTGEILMTRGVKQGVLPSTLLFNIAMGPLLEVIGKQNNGYKYGPKESDRIESLCYADDNALMIEGLDEMNKSLAYLEKFCCETYIKKVCSLLHHSIWDSKLHGKHHKTQSSIKGSLSSDE